MSAIDELVAFTEQDNFEQEINDIAKNIIAGENDAEFGQDSYNSKKELIHGLLVYYSFRKAVRKNKEGGDQVSLQVVIHRVMHPMSHQTVESKEIYDELSSAILTKLS